MRGKTNSRKTSSYYNSVYNTIPKNPKNERTSNPFVFVITFAGVAGVFTSPLRLLHRLAYALPSPPIAPECPLRRLSPCSGTGGPPFFALAGDGGVPPFLDFVASVAGVAGVADVADVADVDCFSRKIRRSLRSRIHTRVALF